MCRIAFGCVVLLILSFFQGVSSYASNFLADCDKGTFVDVTLFIMDVHPVNNFARSVSVKRNGAVVTTYFAGETLQVAISSTSGDFAFIATGATFPGGTCDGTRQIGQNADLVMPESGAVTVKAMSAVGHNTVSITGVVTLTEAPTASPTVAPTPTPAPTLTPTAPPTTFEPTPTPTSIDPTYEPTAPPSFPPTPRPSPGPGEPSFRPTTALPTAVPSTGAPSTPRPTAVPSTGAPTETPTPRPSARPTLYPTSSPTSVPSSVPTSAPTGVPTSSAPSVTTAPGGYVVRVSINLDGLGVNDFGQNDQYYVSTLLATAAGIDVSQISGTRVQSAASATLQRRLTGAGIKAEYVISGLIYAQSAIRVTAAVSGYTGDPTFLVDIQSAGGNLADVTSVSGVSFETVIEDQFDHECLLSDGLKLSWSVNSTSDSIAAFMSLADPDNERPWISAGLVRRADYMVPKDGHRHSVYLYDPEFAWSGYFQIDGYFADQINRDASERHSESGISFLQSGYGAVQMGFAEVRDSFGGAKYVLDIEDSNVVMWAHGGNWPLQHTPNARGFTKVSWATGTCEAVKSPFALSPFLIFGILIPPVFFRHVLCRWKKLRKFTDFVRFANLPYLHFMDGISLGGMVMILLYALLVSSIGGTIYYANSYQSPPALWSFDYFSTDKEFDISGLIQATGAVAMMGFWVAILPTARTSFWVYLTGISYERNIKYHKAIVWLAVGSMTMHFLLNYNYTEYHWYQFEVDMVGRAIPSFGVYCLFAFGATTAFAIDLIKKLIPYELFRLTHYLSFLGIVLLILHVPEWPVVYLGFAPGLLLHAFDALRRWVNRKNKIRMKSIQVVKSKNDVYTKITLGIPDDQLYPYYPGQYYFISVPEISSEWHPISVADHSACHENEGDKTVVFFVKSMGVGTWSHKLSQLRDYSAADCVTFSPPSSPMGPISSGAMTPLSPSASFRPATPVRGNSTAKVTTPERSSSSSSKSKSKRGGGDFGLEAGDVKEKEDTKKPKIMPFIAFDGPYGRLSLDIEQYDTVGMICGGVGLTAMLPTLEWIVAQKAHGKLKRLRNVEFHWVVRGLNPLYSTFRMRLCLVVASCIGIKWETEEGEDEDEDEEEEEEEEEEDEDEEEEEDADAGALVAAEAIDLGMDRRIVARMSTKALKKKTKEAKKEAEARKHMFRVSTKVYNSAAGKTEAASSLTNTVVANGRPHVDKIVAGLGACKRVALLLCGPDTLTGAAMDEARGFSNIHVHNETFGY